MVRGIPPFPSLLPLFTEKLYFSPSPLKGGFHFRHRPLTSIRHAHSFFPPAGSGPSPSMIRAVLDSKCVLLRRPSPPVSLFIFSLAHLVSIYFLANYHPTMCASRFAGSFLFLSQGNPPYSFCPGARPKGPRRVPPPAEFWLVFC